MAAVQAQLRQARTVVFRTQVRLDQSNGPIMLVESRSWLDSQVGAHTDVSLRGKLVAQSFVPWDGQAIVIDHLTR